MKPRLIICEFGLIHVLMDGMYLRTVCASTPRGFRIDRIPHDEAPTCLWCAARNYP